MKGLVQCPTICHPRRLASSGRVGSSSTPDVVGGPKDPEEGFDRERGGRDTVRDPSLHLDIDEGPSVGWRSPTGLVGALDGGGVAVDPGRNGLWSCEYYRRSPANNRSRAESKSSGHLRNSSWSDSSKGASFDIQSDRLYSPSTRP